MSNYLLTISRKFHSEVVKREPRLRLGKIGFVGRDDYFDFSYDGDGKFPVGMTSDISWIVDSTWRSPRMKRDHIHKAMDEKTISYLARVTFHELGHAISLAMNGRPQRVALPDYGFRTEGFFQASKNVRKIGFKNEIEAFAAQGVLYEICGIDDPIVTTLKGVLFLTDRTEWAGVLTRKEKARIYTEMRARCDLKSVNRALDNLNKFI